MSEILIQGILNRANNIRRFRPGHLVPPDINQFRPFRLISYNDAGVFERWEIAIAKKLPLYDDLLTKKIRR